MFAPTPMKQTLLIALLAMPLLLAGQPFSLPIQDEEAFMGNVRSYVESVTLGQLFPLKEEGKVRPGAGFRIGYVERNLIFRDNLIAEDQNGSLLLQFNDDPAKEYPNELFRRGFTRVRGEYFRVGGSVGLLFGKFFQVSTGLNVDFRTTSKYKNRWFEDDVRMVSKLKGNDLLRLNGQQFAWVAQVGLQGFSVCYEISLNRFFRPSWGLEHRFQSFGVVYGF